MMKVEMILCPYFQMIDENPEETYESYNDKKIKSNYINAAIDTLNDRGTIIRLRKCKEKKYQYFYNWEKS